MIRTLSYRTASEKYPALPRYRRNVYRFPRIVRERVLTLDARSLKGHVKAVAEQWAGLCSSLGIDHVVFAPEVKCPWLLQRNDYKPVLAAEAYLLEQGLTMTFDGGLVVPWTDLVPFLQQFFWLIRCNADLPYFNFIDGKQEMLGSLCKQGNLHLFTLNEAVETRLADVLPRSRLYEIAFTDCFNKYYATSRIIGRRINW
jgi:hypothetical protein